jgi:large subunit ribosomal protein L10
MMRKNVELKAKMAEELAQQLKQYKTIILVNLLRSPASLVQKARKKLKETEAFVKAVRKAVIQNALKKLGVDFGEIDFPALVIGTNEHPYAVAKLFRENTLPMAAKPGQIAPFDIVVPAGETDLPPGPALSQLKMAGINAKVERGKIAIAKDSVVAKEGEPITAEKVQALQLLGIKPFKAELKIAMAYDGTYYSQEVLSITPEDLTEKLKTAEGYAFNMSVNVNYPTEKNIATLLQRQFMYAQNLALNAQVYSDAFINHLLQKAYQQANALSKKVG